ncbi:MAG: hypothetical protein HQK83_04515 [Fibrobacteria bacterium]|nr:hypothetical protein [Fibrobacteria bacterium]
MTIGNCARCNTKQTELKKSHILSKFGYKALRSSSRDNPNPVAINGTVAFQTSKQIKESLLCHQCEQYFANGCENYIAKLTYNQDGVCRLYKLLGYNAKEADVHHPPEPVAVESGCLNTEYFLQFAISIFWRTTISKDNCARSYTFSEKYNEIFRAYLNNEISFPDQTCVHLSVVDQPKDIQKNSFSRILTIPVRVKYKGYHQHGFLFNGLYFRMYVGEMIPKDKKTACLGHSPRKCLLFAGAKHLPVYETIVKISKEARNTIR